MIGIKALCLICLAIFFLAAIGLDQIKVDE